MKVIKVHKRYAQIIKNRIALKKGYIPVKKDEYVYFPIDEGSTVPQELCKSMDCEVIDLPENFFKKREKVTNLKEFLKEKGIDINLSSFEIVGDIAIIDIPEEYERFEKLIAEGIMKIHKKVKTVLKKSSGMEGIMRIRRFTHLLGEKKTKTMYKENGCVYEVDVAKMFYSTRLANERLRIAKLVKDGENVLVPFCGYGPFAILIAKLHPNSKVVGIDINHDAIEYFKRNIKLNKLTNVTAVEGDVKDVIKRYPSWADRIVMPLPKDSIRFITHVLPSLKNRGYIHVYTFVKKGEDTVAKKEIETIARKLGYTSEFVFERVVRPYTSTIDEIVLDVYLQKS